MDQESCRTSDVPLSRDFLGSASTFRTFITTTVFFIIADRLSVAAVPCEIAGAMPVGDGICFVVFRLLCVFGARSIILKRLTLSGVTESSIVCIGRTTIP